MPYLHYLIRFLLPIMMKILKKYYDMKETQFEKWLKSFCYDVFTDIFSTITYEDIENIENIQYKKLFFLIQFFNFKL